MGGWPDKIVAPSAIKYDEDSPTPVELSLDDIEDLKKDWVAATKRAVEAGFDVSTHAYIT